MPVISIVLIVAMLIFYIIALYTKFSLVFMSFGVLILWAYRFYTNQTPDYIQAFAIGVKTAFYAYLIYIPFTAFVFPPLRTCPTILIFGLLIAPIMSGIAAAVTNIIPQFGGNGAK